MNAERFLAHYECIADAPDAIGRLRRLILDLSVRGKLVPQDPKDEPASELLKQIGLEKHPLMKKDGSRVSSTFERVSDSEVQYMLPESWTWARVGQVFKYDAGIKREPRELVSDRWLLELEDIEKNSGRFVKRRVRERQSLSIKSEFDVGDILYGKLRPYLNKVVVADDSGYSTTEIVAIRPLIGLDSAYCALAFRRPDFVDLVERLGRGTKMPRLRTPDAVAAPFPLPPLAEQQRIVAKVDELMALCDRLEAERAERETTRDRLTAASFTRLSAPDSEIFHSDAGFMLHALPALTARPDQIMALRKTILDLAVRGKLVPQDPTDEPASELLKRIAVTKVERRTRTGDARIKAVPNPTPESLPMTLPEGWAVQSFENLFLFVDYRGKTPPKMHQGVPLITAKNIRMGYLNREPREYISEDTFRSWMTRGYPQLGDLFFTTEAPLANVCLNDIEESFALAQRVICLQPYGDVETRFFMLALMSELMQSLIIVHATGTTAKGIKTAKLKPLPIPVPPLAEQQRIVAKVDELMALCDQLEAALRVGRATRSCLLNALIADALEPNQVPEMSDLQASREELMAQ